MGAFLVGTLNGYRRKLGSPPDALLRIFFNGKLSGVTPLKGICFKTLTDSD